MEQRYYSNVYWHFTGSPRNVNWGQCRRPSDILQQGKPRPAKEALQTLIAILASEHLKATCTEKLTERLQTDAFCCVTDIPLVDLQLHKRYYGDVALGFACSAIHRRFNPVLYFPNARFQRKPLSGDPSEGFVVDDYDDIDTQSYNVEELPDGRFLLKWKALQLSLFYDVVDSAPLAHYFANHLKITDFSPQAGASFYQEREWRHFGDFYFNANDVEAVIVPKRLKEQINEFLVDAEDLEHVSVLTWEFLRNA